VIPILNGKEDEPHRTGSSTVASIIHRLGDAQNSTFFVPPKGKTSTGLGWPHAFPGIEAVKMVGAPKHQFDMISNNAVYNDALMREYLKPSPFIFTILRDPLSRLTSQFGVAHPPCRSEWGSRINWLEKIGHKSQVDKLGKRGPTLKAQFLNSQAHDLGWYERVSGSSKFDHDDVAIKSWIAELESSLGFVMLREYMKESLVLLRRKLGVQIRDVAHINMKVGDGTPSITAPTEKETKKLEKVLHVDQALYQHFNNTFWKEWEAAGGYLALNAELNELMKENTAITNSCAKKDQVSCPWRLNSDDEEYTHFLLEKQRNHRSHI